MGSGAKKIRTGKIKLSKRNKDLKDFALAISSWEMTEEWMDRIEQLKNDEVNRRTKRERNESYKRANALKLHRKD